MYESGNELVLEEAEAPSNYTKKQKWHNRTQYGNILRGLLSSQLTCYKRESNRIKKTRISQNIVSIVSAMASLIRDESGVEDRLAALEQLAGVVKKGKISR